MSHHIHPLHQRRRAGILLHPTSLPGPFPRGTVCHDAYRFMEFLSRCGISVWQMLPLGPTHSDLSPYQSLSAHACDMSLISLDWLVDQGLLDSVSNVSDAEQHTKCLQTAWRHFKKQPNEKLYRRFKTFIENQVAWLGDYSLFMAIREQQQNRTWMSWPAALRDRESSALQQARIDLANQIGFHNFVQFVFFEQWQALKAYAQQHGVLLFGDLPIYVSQDSADVWAHRDLFLLDKLGEPKIVTGVPPDYFSETGQRWGNPQYDWSELQERNFEWWRQRMATQLSLFDIVRIDHFRGLEAYWEIRADQETAVDGRWVKAPGEAMLSSLQEAFAELPLVAEDLGVITPQVTALREQFDLPGMKILQFAFDGNPDNAYLPHNHEFNSVVYTGTHDNDTTVSWYAELDDKQRDYLHRYLHSDDNSAIHWQLIRTALASVACLAVVPMQDVLGLDGAHRMNTPGTTEGNWQWRFDWEQIKPEHEQQLADLCQLYHR